MSDPEPDLEYVLQQWKLPYTVVRAPAGAYVVHPEDVLDDVATIGPETGCCGPDGCDGPNRACACGQVLGTLRADCWTCHEMRFDPDAVVVA